MEATRLSSRGPFSRPWGADGGALSASNFQIVCNSTPPVASQLKLDASLRVGRPVTDHIDGFVNLRYLGGGAEGTSKDEDDFGDGYNENWLHFATVSLGFTYGAAMR